MQLLAEKLPKSEWEGAKSVASPELPSPSKFFPLPPTGQAQLEGLGIVVRARQSHSGHTKSLFLFLSPSPVPLLQRCMFSGAVEFSCGSSALQPHPHSHLPRHVGGAWPFQGTARWPGWWSLVSEGAGEAVEVRETREHSISCKAFDFPLSE